MLKEEASKMGCKGKWIKLNFKEKEEKKDDFKNTSLILCYKENENSLVYTPFYNSASGGAYTFYSIGLF